MTIYFTTLSRAPFFTNKMSKAGDSTDNATVKWLNTRHATKRTRARRKLSYGLRESTTPLYSVAYITLLLTFCLHALMYTKTLETVILVVERLHILCKQLIAQSCGQLTQYRVKDNIEWWLDLEVYIIIFSLVIERNKTLYWWFSSNFQLFSFKKPLLKHSL